ncbi:MAG: hypothetical protein LBK83_13060 [Treponema sp.]|jgi:hypothetical protein|nr:hypothetical protein [Treponema sp.]
MRTKRFFLFGLPAALLALSLALAGCPTDTVLESGEDYVAAATLVNEKAKYETAVVFEFDADDTGTDVTARFMETVPGKSASREVRVSISGVSGEGFFFLDNGQLIFTGKMPPSVETRSELVAAIAKETNEETKATLEAQLYALDDAPNTEVATLRFEKDGTSSSLDVLGVIRRKGEGKAPERKVADVLKSFVIYGYDVINSGYINRNEVKKGYPILDAVKVDAGGLLIQDDSATSSTWTSTSGESIVELMEKINAALSAEYKSVAFSGKVEAEFATSSSAKQTTRFAKGQGFHIAREDFLSRNQPRALKNYLDEYFVEDINSESAAYLLRVYGTHLITGCLLGGEAEFNYSYTGSELNDDMKITAALNATYGSFSGSASGGYESQKKELNDNSVFTSSSRGGNNTSFTSAEQFMSGYAAWVDTVRSNPDLCGIPSFERLIPLWEIVEQINPTKANAIQAEFERMVQVQGIKLAGFTYKPDRSYVTDIEVFTQTIKDGVPTGRTGYTNLVKDDMYSPDKGAVTDTSGKRFYPSNILFSQWTPLPYVVYNLAAATPNNAIAEVRVARSDAQMDTGWQKINIDLTLGGRNYYLWYRKVTQTDTQAIDFIGLYSADSPGSGQLLSGYEWVNMYETTIGSKANSSVTLVSTINLGRINLSDYGYTYLTVRKIPFEWKK